MKEITKMERAIKLAYDRGYRVTKGGTIIGLRGKPLKVSVYNAYRYPAFGLNKVPFTNTGSIKIPIHRFAAYCFYGNEMFNEGIEVRHLNGDVFDFSKSNIALGTSSQNKMDSPKDVRVKKAAKLTFKEVREVRSLFEQGKRAVSLSDKYGVSIKTIYNVVNKETYAHVD